MNFIVAPQIPQDNTPRWKKRAEIVAVGVAAGLLIVNIFQMFATQKAADSAEKSANVADFTLRLTGRAYINPETGNGVDFVKGSVGHIAVVVRNNGHTPAIDYNPIGYDRYIARNEQITVPTEEGAVKSTLTSLGVGAPSVIDSNTMHGPKPPSILDDNIIAALKNGDLRYYFIVYITYKDMFPGNSVHHTMFCRELQRNLITIQTCPGVPERTD